MNFQTIKISGWQFELSDDFPAGFLPDIAGAASFIDGQRSSFVKLPSSKFAKVFKFNVYLKGKIYSLILKQYLNRSFFDILKNSLRPCRAERAFKAGRMLKRYGFFTPDIVAVGRKTFAGIPTGNFLITSQVENSVPLYKMLDIDISQKQQLIKQFGQTVGRMHAAGIFHGDLRLGNVLVKPVVSLSNPKDDNRFVFIFLDNERTKKYDKLPHRLRLKNLVQVFFSCPNAGDDGKNCFLDAYLSQQKMKINKDKLFAQIAARVKKRLAAKGVITNEHK